MANMTNEEKYKTPEERVEAYCASKGLSPCTMGYALAIDYFGWLAHEAKDKPLPCPFCDGETHTNLGHLKAGVVHYWVDCISPDCMYRSGNYTTEAEAVAAHNRVARAVRKAKESEAKCGVMGAFHCPHQTTCGCDCPEPCQFKVIEVTVSSASPISLSKESEVK